MNPTPPPPLPADAALFLDFDGTLVALAPRPQDVAVPPRLPSVLQALHGALDGALALVSGRPVAQLDALLAPLALPAAGVHGVECRGSDGVLRRHAAEPPAEAVAAAQALTLLHEGLLFEPKPGGFALHYRARPALGPACHEALLDALAAAPDGTDWQVMAGHCVFEVKLQRVSKGVAVAALMGDPRFAGRRPVYIGDDVTDEDGIRAVQQAGGIGVRVGGGATQARHWLQDPPAVLHWLGEAARRLVVPRGAAEPAPHAPPSHLDP